MYLVKYLDGSVQLMYIYIGINIYIKLVHNYENYLGEVKHVQRTSIFSK